MASRYAIYVHNGTQYVHVHVMYMCAFAFVAVVLKSSTCTRYLVWSNKGVLQQTACVLHGTLFHPMLIVSLR